MKFKTLVFLVVFLLTTASFALSVELVLVVNKENPVSSLSVKNVEKIFLGKKTTWDNGHKINLLTQKNHDLHEAFTAAFLAKNAQQFNLFWKKALFTGTALPPTLVQDDTEVKAVVSKDIAAIGYIAKSSLDESVKPLTTD